ncbi:hypothetical protein KIN20_028076 [Parelaphostrongylus tenuis]|uniref:Uncharacterized protein n=1 Tax=Parelaphostrongylus tenuis TaxID=148309 RepID=A0AAD5R0J8_PARTN|nr:hypothetical protein KIN20_028076 [Parelaphostrongylus tenuis]
MRALTFPVCLESIKREFRCNLASNFTKAKTLVEDSTYYDAPYFDKEDLTHTELNRPFIAKTKDLIQQPKPHTGKLDDFLELADHECEKAN